MLQLIAQVYDVSDAAWVCIPPDLFPHTMFQRAIRLSSHIYHVKRQNSNPRDSQTPTAYLRSLHVCE